MRQVLVFYDIINQKNVYYPFIKIVIINCCGVNVSRQYVSFTLMNCILTYHYLYVFLKPWTNIFKRRYNEVQEHQDHRETNRVRTIVADVLQKYPHLRDDEERVLEEYKKRFDFEQFHVPKRLAQRPKLRAHHTVWNEQEFIDKGTLEDPNSEDYDRLQTERAARKRRKKNK